MNEVNTKMESEAMEAAALRRVVAELTGKVQFLVEFLDKHGLLEEHMFTFPDGDVWKSQDIEIKK